MRQLHVVALSEDGRFLLLAPGKDATKGAFRVALDARLNAAVRGELPRPGATTAPASGLTPKEIQARLRAGESVEQIARSAGVPAARVERFAGPVEGEMARIIEAARAAVLTRARRGASAVSLGEAVSAHLVEVDVDPADVVWTARREDDGGWLVAASFTSRGRKKRSTWRYDPGTRELTAADASSAVLGYVEPPDARPRTKTVAAVAAPGRRRAASSGRASATRRSPAAPQVPAAAKAPAKAPAKRSVKAPAKAPAKAAAKTAKAPARSVAAPATTVKAPAAARTTRKAAAPARVVAPAPAANARPKAGGGAGKADARPAAARPPASPPPAARAPRRRGPAAGEAPPATPTGPPQLRVVPSPDEEPRARASVPTWADVLLSTTPPSRPAATEGSDD